LLFRGSYKGKRLRYVYAKLIGGYKNVVWSVFTDTHTHRQPTRYCGLQDFCVVSGADDGFATFDVEIRRFAKPYRIYRKTKVGGLVVGGDVVGPGCVVSTSHLLPPIWLLSNVAAVRW
jgi:hypothetical protein